MLNIVLVAIGFFPLVFGANFLVDGASSLAKKFNIPNIVIGLTIVAFGTSMPEFVVNIFAAIGHNTDVAIGNIVGSNIFNILGIIGISAIIYPVAVQSNTTWKEIPLTLMSALVLFIAGNDKLIDGRFSSSISRIDGLIFIFFFIIFIVYNFQIAKTGNANTVPEIKDLTLKKSLLLIVLGVILLIVGGNIIVTFAVKFAETINISERVIGLTIVAIGTSLPELATSVASVLKKESDIAIGNVVGSNIFNVFFILGVTATITEIPNAQLANLDLIVNILASILLFICIFTGKGRKIERWEGVLMVILYVSYTVYIIV